MERRKFLDFPFLCSKICMIFMADDFETKALSGLTGLHNWHHASCRQYRQGERDERKREKRERKRESEPNDGLLALSREFAWQRCVKSAFLFGRPLSVLSLISASASASASALGMRFVYPNAVLLFRCCRLPKECGVAGVVPSQ